MSASPAATSGPLRNVYSVTRLNQEAKGLLEDAFPLLWVEGELSNLARPASGHWYFSLKDAAAQVRCAMFRGANRQVSFSPGNGTQVLVRGRVSLYAPRGDFQLIVEHMEEAGLGALLRAFEALKQRLAAQGLFDQERKRPLPALPRRIGVVTSPSGAAIRDVLSVLRRRFPAIPVLLYPTAVQGEEAPQAIAKALASACARKDCDALLVTRGGGSLEDLWAFNDERVARAIAACDIPVVSAVGHEVDFTIADFVADRRAPTPSAAAELLSPDQAALRRDLEAHLQRLAGAARGRCAAARQRLVGLQARLAHQHPERRLQAHAQRLDELERRLTRAMSGALQGRRARLAELGARLRHHLPLHRLGQLQARRERLHLRLVTAVRRTTESRERRLAGTARALGAVSPLATLERGYAIVTRPDSGEVIRRAEQVQAGESVRARLGRGTLRCRVEGVEDAT